MIEPHLARFFGLMVALIGSERRFPSRKKWEAWHNMLKGVHYLIISTDATHANIAYSNELAEIDPLWPSKEFDKERARQIWKAARKVQMTNPY